MLESNLEFLVEEEKTFKKGFKEKRKGIIFNPDFSSVVISVIDELAKLNLNIDSKTFE